MEKIALQDGWIIFEPHFYFESEADTIFQRLLKLDSWQQGTVRIFGKEYPTPRLESFHAENGLSYGYSGQRMTTIPFDDTLNSIREKLFSETGFTFNSVLCNLYRDGNDSNGWHADNEHELGKDPVIASISFGASRRFDLKHEKSGEKRSFELTPGSLLIMGGSLQHHWKHQIPKTKVVDSPRINLTFRNIVRGSVI
jgi:alkylated DNA repair dioxygenase AlkB